MYVYYYVIGHKLLKMLEKCLNLTVDNVKGL